MRTVSQLIVGVYVLLVLIAWAITTSGWVLLAIPGFYAGTWYQEARRRYSWMEKPR